MNTPKWLAALCAACLAVMTAGAAGAHDLWLAPATATPDAGKTLTILVGFGHEFPANRVDQQVRPGMIESVTALGPDGKTTPLAKVSESEYKLAADAPGAYMVSARMKPGFFSRAQGGMKRGNKKQVSGVEKCMFFRMIANAPLWVGDAEPQAPPAPADQALQVVPRGDVTKLKAGDELPVQVLFNGQPLAGARLRATYAGYAPPAPPAPEPGVKLSPKEAARQKAMRKLAPRHVVDVETNAQGMAKLSLSSPGWWLVFAAHQTPYGDAATCDSNVYKTTYTFEVHE